MSRGSVAAALVVTAAFVACGGGDGERQSPRDGSEEGSANPAPAGAREVHSEIGKVPEYFVPHQAGSPLAIVGRAELLASGKPVELSVNPERVGPIGPALCVNPAYRGRGQLGVYIPASCFATPLPKLATGRVDVPQQAVRRYELVIWGVTRGADGEVSARFGNRRASAAVFSVNGRLARKVGAERPFSVFVAELPSEAACGSITLEARSEAGRAIDPIARKPKICRAGGRD